MHESFACRDQICGFALLATLAACGHPEPIVKADAHDVASRMERSPVTVEAGPPPERDAAAAMVGATDAGEAVIDGAVDAGGGDAAVADVPVHCIDAPKTPARTLIRLANHSRARRTGEPSCRVHQLALEIPSLGLTRELCTVTCGQFLFDSQKKGPSRATFVCENDFVLQAGTVWVSDGVLFSEIHDNRPPRGFGENNPARPVSIASDAIPLPCGARPEIQTAGRLESGPANRSTW